MSLAFGVTCLTCRAWAPTVGSHGFLGAPQKSVAEAVDVVIGEPIPSFGFFFEALRGMGLEPYDLVAYDEFLAAHDGHHLLLAGENDDLPADVTAVLDAADFPRRRDAIAADDRERARRTASGEFVEWLYELTCDSCQTSLLLDEPDLLRAGARANIDISAATLFLERWDQWDAGACSMNLMGAADPYAPFMAKLIAFVKAHGSHRLRRDLRP